MADKTDYKRRMCGESMTFPSTPEQFIHDYEFEDARRIYTNGSLLIPTFRVKQMIEHYLRSDKSDWISVADALPPCGKMVQLYTTYETSRPTLGYLYKPDKPENSMPYFIFFAWNFARQGYLDYGRFICPGNENVTHWMPLPAPPDTEVTV